MSRIRATYLLLIVVGCGFESPLPTPTITSVSPAVALAAEMVALTIEGSGFVVVASATLGKEEGNVESVSASVGTMALVDVVVESTTRVTATLPAGLDVGTYDLVLTIGDRTATWPGFEIAPPFQVALTAPDDLAFGEEGALGLEITNDSNEAVTVELLSLTSNSPEVEVSVPSLASTIPPNESRRADGTIVNRSRTTGPVDVVARLSWANSSTSGAFDLTQTVQLLGGASASLTYNLPAQLEIGQIETLTATVTNDGALDLEGVLVTVTSSGGLQLLDTPTIANTLNAGEVASWGVRLQATSLGLAAVSIQVSARATRGSDIINLSERQNVDVVEGPKLLINSITIPAAVEVGVPVAGEVVVINGGDAALLGGVLELQTSGGAVTAAPFGDLAVAQQVRIPITVTASTRGVPVRIDAVAAGRSELSARRVVSPTETATTGPALSPAALRVTVSASPDPALVGQPMSLAVTITNDGDGFADQVEPTNLVLDPTASPDGLRVPAAQVTIAGGASSTFRYPLRAAAAGTFTAMAGASGVNRLTAMSIAAPSVVSPSVNILVSGPPTAQILEPSFAEVVAGQQFGFVIGAAAGNGRTLANIQAATAGPVMIIGSTSSPQTKSEGAAVFLAEVSAAASPGQTITLLAEAENDLGQIGTAAALTLDVVASPSLVSVACTPSVVSVTDNDSDTEVRLEALFANGYRIDVTNSVLWASSDPNIATVDIGAVRGKNIGVVTVTGTFMGMPGTCTVNVRGAGLFFIEPARMATSVGAATQLRYAERNRGDFTELSNDGETTWVSSNPAIASVVSGQVTGVSAGIVTITACNDGQDCATAEVLVGSQLDLPGALGPGPIAMSGPHALQSLIVRSGAEVYSPKATLSGTFVAWQAPLELTISGSAIIEAGARLSADGGSGQSGAKDGAHSDFEAEGGSSGNSGGGGGAGSGGGSDRCNGDNCGGFGAARGTDACSGGACSGGDGGGPGGGAGAAPTMGQNGGFAGGGGGHGGRGGCGGTITTGCAGLGGSQNIGGGAANGGGSGGGGGDGEGAGGGPAGGGGGGGGVVALSLTGTAAIIVNGTISARGGDGGSILRNGRSGAGGGGSGGLIEINAPVIDGVGILEVGGGFGGSGSVGADPCGGGGGGGGGRVVLSSVRPGPFLRTRVNGGQGGTPCTTGGAAGIGGEIGIVTRP